jgi:hypothetical protein
MSTLQLIHFAETTSSNQGRVCCDYVVKEYNLHFYLKAVNVDFLIHSLVPVVTTKEVGRHLPCIQAKVQCIQQPCIQRHIIYKPTDQTARERPAALQIADTPVYELRMQSIAFLLSVPLRLQCFQYRSDHYVEKDTSITLHTEEIFEHRKYKITAFQNKLTASPFISKVEEVSQGTICTALHKWLLGDL